METGKFNLTTQISYLYNFTGGFLLLLTFNSVYVKPKSQITKPTNELILLCNINQSFPIRRLIPLTLSHLPRDNLNSDY